MRAPVNAADQVPFLGRKALGIQLEFGGAVTSGPGERGIPRWEELLVGVPNFFSLEAFAFVGCCGGVVLALRQRLAAWEMNWMQRPDGIQ